MEPPGYDPVAASGPITSGANPIRCTTGRGAMAGSRPASAVDAGQPPAEPHPPAAVDGEAEVAARRSPRRRPMSRTHRIAAIPGDGIGKEVMPEGLRVLHAAAKRFGFGLDVTPIAWASCDHHAATGQMMPDDWKAQLQGLDALYFGAVGWPATVPDHVSLWGSLLKFRREFDQYVNLRPVRLFEGVPCPLAGRKPGDIDYLIVRENTEGEYTSLGGVMYAGTEREIVVQESVYSRFGADRVLKVAFELARLRPRRQLTVATKSNGIAISMPWWDARADAVGAGYPEVRVDKQHIDILSARFVLQPQRFDVVVATNLFGDILSDLGPATTGTIGLAPSANLNPERAFPSLFEPVHGSAPDIYGSNIANPIAMIWSGALMLDFLGERAAHDAILRAIERVLVEGPRTADLGGCASTTEVGRAIAERVAAG
jgi:tartrate dehydrogenase/decarboxylase/D-malate dehydrogenase